MRTRLVALSALSPDFLVLLAGATIIATLGLFQSSPAVIIGAMIIAPLMRPLMGLSLATISADLSLLRRALVTLTLGTAFSLAISISIGHLLGAIELTSEMMARTTPNLLDLGVAFAAGVVGAYCYTNPKLGDTLAGVAIAVALVPPLCVVGIGIAQNNPSVATGSFILYATNLIGITIAGSLVFLVLGYTPLGQAKKGLAVSGALLVLLLIPLGFSMDRLMLENRLTRQVKYLLLEKTHTFKALRLRDVEVKSFEHPVTVTATVFTSPQEVTPTVVRKVQNFLSRETGVDIRFKLRMIPQTEVDAREILPVPEPSPSTTSDSGDITTQTSTPEPDVSSDQVRLDNTTGKSP